MFLRTYYIFRETIITAHRQNSDFLPAFSPKLCNKFQVIITFTFLTITAKSIGHGEYNYSMNISVLLLGHHIKVLFRLWRFTKFKGLVESIGFWQPLSTRDMGVYVHGYSNLTRDPPSFQNSDSRGNQRQSLESNFDMMRG